MKIKLTLAAIVAVAAAAIAHAGPRPAVVDSTGFRPGIVGTPIPQPVFPLGSDRGGVGSNVAPLPVGYHEVTVATGNRYLGQNQSGAAAAAFYYALGYPLSSSIVGGGEFGPNRLNVNACSGYSGPGKVLAGDTSYTDVNGQYFPGPTDYVVCEPQGTRSTLVKDVGAQTIMLSNADVNAYALPGTIGVNVGTATPICQARGYTNFVPGTISYVDRGNGCFGDQITQWNGSGFVKNDACYNLQMNGMQCWK